MSIAWTLLFVAACGIGVGAAGRWLVPGPDPMPAWLTSAIGLAGSGVGVGTAVALVGLPQTAGDAYGLLWPALGVSLIASALLVVAYRRLVQGRPLRGPEARRMPARGIGVAQARARLGLDPGPAAQQGEPEALGADVHADVNVQEQRVAAVVVAAAAGLVALSTQLHRFDGPTSALAGWLAWAALLAAVVVGAAPLRPGHVREAARLRRAFALAAALSAAALALTALAALVDG